MYIYCARVLTRCALRFAETVSRNGSMESDYDWYAKKYAHTHEYTCAAFFQEKQ